MHQLCIDIMVMQTVAIYVGWIIMHAVLTLHVINVGIGQANVINTLASDTYTNSAPLHPWILRCYTSVVLLLLFIIWLKCNVYALMFVKYRTKHIQLTIFLSIIIEFWRKNLWHRININIHCEPKKTPKYFWYAVYKTWPIVTKFGTLSWVNLSYRNVNAFRLTWIVFLLYLVKLSIHILQVNSS